MAMFEILNYSHIIIHQVLMLKNGVFLEVNSDINREIGFPEKL